MLLLLLSVLLAAAWLLATIARHCSATTIRPRDLGT